MKAIFTSAQFHFGIGYPTPLPPGWTLRETVDDWAIAVDQSGREYYLGTGKAYPRRRFVGENLPPGIKHGDHYVDLENGVIDLVATEVSRSGITPATETTPNLPPAAPGAGSSA